MALLRSLLGALRISSETEELTSDRRHCFTGPASAGEVAAVLALAVLTSPAHSGNTNEASMSEQREDLLPKRPVALTDMPDEILLRIFHYLPQLEAARTPRGTPKLHYLYINKRIYHLARPKWYKHINIAFDKQGNNRNLMERLLWAAEHPSFRQECEGDAVQLGPRSGGGGDQRPFECAPSGGLD